MKAGKSFSSFCVKVDACRDTLYLWMRQNPIFLDSYKKGRTHLFAYMTQLAQNYLIEYKDGAKMNTNLYVKLMKLHFGKDLFNNTHINIDPSEFVNFEGTPLEKMNSVSVALKNSLISLEQYKVLMDGIRAESDIIYNEQIEPLLKEKENA